MTFLHVFFSRVRSYFRNAREESRLEEELRSHLEMLADEHVAHGMTPEEARMAARRDMGGVEQAKEAHRDARRFIALSAMGQDLRYAVRQLRKTPGFSALTIATLAVGIGVNAAMFTVIDQTLLRKLPYPDAGRLVTIDAVRQLTSSVAYNDVKAWRKRDRDFSQIAYYFGSPVSVDEKTSSDLLFKVNISANLFSTLGVKPILGRTFTEAEQERGRNSELVLSEDFWRDKLYADPAILGKTLTVGGQIYTIIGVMPHGFSFPANDTASNEIWAPFVLEGSAVQELSWSLTTIARLKPGVSVQQVAQNLNSIQHQLNKEDHKNHDAAKLKVTLYRDAFTNNIRPALTALEAAVAMVWLIACANVAGLMLTRMQGRRRELSIRSALGAGKLRLVSQLLMESLLLSVLAGLLGFGLSQAVTAILGRAAQQHLPVPVELHVSWTLFAVLLGGVLISALLIGVVPALHAASTSAQVGLRDSSARSGVSRHQGRIRDSFVVAQVALSFVLLVSAGLMLRTFYSFRHVPLGFTTEHIIDSSLFIPPHQYQKKDIVTTLYQPLLDRLRHTPGVEDAALTSVLPVQTNFDANASFSFVGRPKPEPGHGPQAALRIVSSNIYTLLRIPLLRGRLFTPFDSAGTQMVAVVNQSFVRAYFKHEDPLGKQIDTGDGPLSKATIVGVVGDVHQKTLNVASSPELDVSLAQIGPKNDLYFLLSYFMQIAVRTHGDPPAMIPTIRNVLHHINPDLALNKFTTLQQGVDNSFGSQALAGRLLTLFACLALLIAAAGLYALLAYSVSQRTHEIGVRVALGAQRSQIFGMVLHHASLLAGIGLVLGVAGAWFAADVLQSFLYGVGAHDWLTMSAVAIVLIGVCLFASFVPARRAASVDPMVALRHE